MSEEIKRLSPIEEHNAAVQQTLADAMRMETEQPTLFPELNAPQPDLRDSIDEKIAKIAAGARGPAVPRPVSESAADQGWDQKDEQQLSAVRRQTKSERQLAKLAVARAALADGIARGEQKRQERLSS